eukprot:gene3972-biopygen3906
MVNAAVLEPQKIKRFDVLGEVTDVAAGRQHSAAILSSGEMYTWGSGSCGKLGHSDNAGNCCVPTLARPAPQRVLESRLHGFGENKEGQCGKSARTPAVLLTGQLAVASLLAGAKVEAVAHAASQDEEVATTQLNPRLWMLSAVKPVDVWEPPLSCWLGSNGKSENRIGFGQIRTPTPIPRGTTTHQTSPGGDEEESGELGSRKVDQASASTYFSIAKTADGEVWTCGAGFLGELGHAKTWSPAFCQVAGGLRESLRQRGGATSVHSLTLPRDAAATSGISLRCTSIAAGAGCWANVTTARFRFSVMVVT